MGSEVDHASSTQPHLEEQHELQSESQGSGMKPGTKIGQAIQNLRQLKSFEILRSAVRNFAGNFRFMLLMISSTVPLCAFMVFYDVKLHNIIESLPDLANNSHRIISVSVASSSHYLRYHRQHDEDDGENFQRNFYFNHLQFSLSYLVLYPLLDICSVFITIKFAAKTHSGETEIPVKHILHQSDLCGVFATYLSVHLLSTLTLLGLFWVVVNHHIFSPRNSFVYGPHSIEFYLNLLSMGLHFVIFIALLYKYLGWSAFWNMAVVISVLEEETGIGAFGLSDYYGKHCKQTGFQLMLVFFAFCNFLRLPSLFFGLCNSSFTGVCFTAIVIGFFCLGNLVKWVAMLLYFYDCKEQVMEKKGDEELGKSLKKVPDVS